MDPFSFWPAWKPPHINSHRSATISARSHCRVPVSFERITLYEPEALACGCRSCSGSSNPTPELVPRLTRSVGDSEGGARIIPAGDPTLAAHHAAGSAFETPGEFKTHLAILEPVKTCRA